MIFNATGGAHTSGQTTAPRLPKLSTVLDDVAAAVIPGPPAAAPATQPPAAQDKSTGTAAALTGSPSPAGKAAGALSSALANIPAQVLDRAPSTAPAFGQRAQNQLATVLDAHDSIRPESLMVTNAQDVVTTATTLASDEDPVQALAALPGGFVSGATGILATALAPFITPGPTAPAEPPLLLGVLAWARREIQRTFFNSAPTAVEDTVETSQDTDLDITAAQLLGNDTDADGDALTVGLPGGAATATTAEGGTVTDNGDGTFTYTPAAGFVGEDSFDYAVSDQSSGLHLHGLEGLLSFGGGHTSTGSVTVTVLPGNRARHRRQRLRHHQRGRRGQRNPARRRYRRRRRSADLRHRRRRPESRHTLLSTSNGSFTYTPAANYNGPDSFTYKANNGTADPTRQRSLSRSQP